MSSEDVTQPQPNQPATDGQSAAGLSDSRDSAGGRGQAKKASLVTGVILLLVAGVLVFGATVPVYAVSAQKSLGAMLPSTTAFYLAADLNPAGSTKTNLNRIRSAFVNQPGWSKSSLVSGFHHATSGKGASGKCYRQTESQVSGDLRDLGHQSAVALTSTKGIRLAPQNGAFHMPMSAVKRDWVILAPIHAQRTMFQLLTGSGFSFGLPVKHSSYKGTTIYADRFRACGQASHGTAQTVYAADFKNWVLLGAVPGALYPVIDTGNGSRPALASSTSYERLMAGLPGDQLGSYYLSGSALRKMGLTKKLESYYGPSVSPSTFKAIRQPSAGALSVDAAGFSFTALTARKSNSHGHPAGLLASSLPANVEAFLSGQSLRPVVQGGLSLVNDLVLEATSTTTFTTVGEGVTTCNRSAVIGGFRKPGHLSCPGGTRRSRFGYPPATQQAFPQPKVPKTVRRVESAIRQVVSDMSGETDLVMFHPKGRLDISKGESGLQSVPLALTWQVRPHARNIQDLDHLVRAFPGKVAIANGRTADGTRYRRAGPVEYAVRSGWAVASFNVPAVIKELSKHPSHSLTGVPGYQAVIPTNAKPSSVWYVNLSSLRRSLEAAFKPKAKGEWRSYVRSFRPSVVPIVNLGGSAGTEGSFGYTKIEVGIGGPGTEAR